MNKQICFLIPALFFISGCSSVLKDRSNYVDQNNALTLTEQRTLVKNFSVQQRISGGFTLCSEVGVWKCLPLTKKTEVNPLVEVSVTDSSSIDQFNRGIEEARITSSNRWAIQVGAYKSDAAIEQGLAILSAKNVGFIKQKKAKLTLLSVTGFSTKEDALRELNHYVDDFNDAFVKKMTH